MHIVSGDSNSYGAKVNSNGALQVYNEFPTTAWSYAAQSGGIVNTSDVTIKAAAGAGVRNYIRSIQIKNVSLVASEVRLRDGATIIWRGHAPASMLTADVIRFDPPLYSTANTALIVAMGTTSTQTYVNAQGATGE